MAGQIAALHEQQSTRRDVLGNLHAESGGFHRQAEGVARELAVAGERLRQLQARHEETQREVAPLRLEHATLAQRLADLRVTLITAQAEHAGRQQAVEELQQAVNQRQQERAGLQGAVETARRTLTEVQRKRIDCNSRLTGLNERRHSLRTDCESQQRALQNAQGEASSAQQALQKADTQTHLDEKQAHDLQAKLAQFEQATSELRQRLDAAERTRQTADRAADRLQTRYDLLRRLRDEGAGYASGVRAVLQAGGPGPQKATLPGILGTVAALVRVPAQLDTAIETALGGALQNVITQQWDDARQAIDFLKQSGHGRATFLPLDRLNVLPAIAAPDRPGILGNAVELVEYDPRIEAVVQQLLNRVWIAQDLNAARAALNAVTGSSRPTVVTLEGEIIRPGGAVTGGNDTNRRDESMLARARELRELPAQITQAAQQVQGSSALCVDLNRQLEAMQLQIETQQQTLADLARQERHQRQQSEEARRHADRAQQAVRWQTERLAQINAELATLDAKEVALLAEQGQVQAAEAQAVAGLAQTENELQATGIGDLLQELADRRATAAEALGHLRSQQALLENQQRTYQSITDQIRAKEARIVTLHQEGNTQTTQVEQLTQTEASLSQQLEHLRRQIEPVEAQLAQWQTEQRSAEGQRTRAATGVAQR